MGSRAGPRDRGQWAALAAGLAHEIKNPLSTINISLQLLREDLESKKLVPSAQIRPRIDLLIGEVERLQRILRDFLRLAREPELNLGERDLNTLIEEMRAFLGPELRERRIDSVAQLDRSAPKIRCDADLLRQAILNLVRNAMDAMEGGGTITIQTRGEGSSFVIEVIDTGHGIDEELQSRVFDGFFSTKRGGTGVGLTLTRQIIELHGGTVSFESAKGYGSKFRIELPFAGPPRPERQAG